MGTGPEFSASLELTPASSGAESLGRWAEGAGDGAPWEQPMPYAYDQPETRQASVRRS